MPRDDVARGDEASSGSDTVPPFGFAKGDLDADGEVCDAPCARCDQIEVGRDADPRDCAAGGNGPFDGVRLTIRRFEAAGLTWPLPDDVTNTVLEARLFASAGAGPGTRQGYRRQAEPDWAAVHCELKATPPLCSNLIVVNRPR
jgi:hypothetical protein